MLGRRSAAFGVYALLHSKMGMRRDRGLARVTEVGLNARDMGLDCIRGYGQLISLICL